MSDTATPAPASFFVRRQRLLREAGYLLAGQGAVAVAGLVGIRILTELAPEAVFGEANLLLGLLMLGRNVFTAPLSNVQLRFHPEYQRIGRLDWFLRQIARVAWTATAAMAAVGVVAYFIWVWRTSQPLRPWLVAALLLVMANETFKSLRLNALSAERRQMRVAAWMGTEAWVWLTTAALALALSKTTESYLLGQVTGGILATILFGILLYPQSRPDPALGEAAAAPDLLPRMARYALPFIPLAVVSWAASLGERYVIAGQLGKADAGLYAAAYGLASRPMVLVGAVLTSFARPILFQAVAHGQADKARRLFAYWLTAGAGIGCASVVGLWALGPWVAKLFLAEAYRAGAPTLFVWVAAGYALFVVTQVLETRILSLGHSAKLIWPTMTAALVNVVIAAILVPRVGVVGGAQATAAAFAAQLLVIAWTLTRSAGSATKDRASPDLPEETDIVS